MKLIKPIPFIVLLFSLTGFLTGCITIYTNENPESVKTLFPSANEVSNSDTCLTLYPECNPWNQTSAFAGEDSCFIGRINKVFSEFDQLSGADIWTAYFDPNAARYSNLAGVREKTTGLVIVSVNRDISNFEGECVVAFGKILDPYDLSDTPRTMVDADPNDTVIGYSLVRCKCP